MDASRLPPTDTVTRSYELYYDSGCYDRRYPGPNRATQRLVMDHLPPSGHVIDYGCGSGRYLLALRDRVGTAAGYDISPAAISLLRRKAAAFGWDDLAILGPDPADLDRHMAEFGPADVILCLFGVLGHIEEAAARQRALMQMRVLLRPGSGRLIVSVPNRLRRFRREQARAGIAARGLIHYRRVLGGTSVILPYQLYDPAGLADELGRAGFTLCEMRPESVLPESWLLHHPVLRGVERFLTPVCPARLGYGILAVAAP
ncbi:class I SAM-dependent methyltransferase [Rhodovulum steppense]|uniref:Methyltransferase family protein n=1 Tax=Rhodovulum steppense TaxID=540251 RepID=A0A4R1YY43_9RHOB|nr:methyltransferase domain-containing protein [Rhodovulum steppense]TCM86135.1 methyltransferase family protein [Rhodovulum steppense]